MALKWLAVVGILLATVPASAGQPGELNTPKDKVSYGIGVDVARNFQRLGIDVDVDVLARAMRDVFGGNKLAMTDEELRSVMTAYQNELRQKAVAAMRKSAEDNQKEGDAFLEENKKKDGVVTLPSGLQYKVLKAGTGKTPTETDTVEVNYRGTLINGTEFDSSARLGKPLELKVNGVIPGWQEALKLMPVGSKWQLFIPPQLAYGGRAPSREIGPNATLIFEVELVAIK